MIAAIFTAIAMVLTAMVFAFAACLAGIVLGDCILVLLGKEGNLP